MSYRTGTFWQPDVTVATVVERDGHLLMVEERVAGNLVYNQPAGHLEPGESILQAAVRETLEETGWQVGLTAFIGAYQWKAPETGREYLRMAFAAEPLQHDAGRVLDEGIIAAHWMQPSEIEALADRHRSPLVSRVIADYLNGSRHPLGLLQIL
jgi:8-oxo-dGTP pyrophosphatase MutT (NUDIX family)